MRSATAAVGRGSWVCFFVEGTSNSCFFKKEGFVNCCVCFFVFKAPRLCLLTDSFLVRFCSKSC